MTDYAKLIENAERGNVNIRAILAALKAEIAKTEKAEAALEICEDSKAAWTGLPCPECKGTGETADVTACPKCGGTGDEFLQWEKRALRAEVERDAACAQLAATRDAYLVSVEGKQELEFKIERLRELAKLAKLFIGGWQANPPYQHDYRGWLADYKKLGIE